MINPQMRLDDDELVLCNWCLHVKAQYYSLKWTTLENTNNNLPLPCTQFRQCATKANHPAKLIHWHFPATSWSLLVSQLLTKRNPSNVEKPTYICKQLHGIHCLHTFLTETESMGEKYWMDHFPILRQPIGFSYITAKNYNLLFTSLFQW